MRLEAPKPSAQSRAETELEEPRLSGRRSQPLVALVEDDPTTRTLYRRFLEHEGWSVVELSSASEALETEEPLDVVCLDLGLDDLDGRELLLHIKSRHPDLPVIVVTAAREVEDAVLAMQRGAYDYVTKPVDRERLVASVQRALEHRVLLRRVEHLEGELGGIRATEQLVGESTPMRNLRAQIGRVLSSDVAVCVLGESGTGKELVARAIHEGGHRARGPFIALNCAAIPESLLESELFGHERGAFTGALVRRKGCFEQAEGGTLFLDEIAEMSAPAQASLLRTLQERTIRRVGGNEEVPVDARIVCATHRDLKRHVETGAFREDLYFRLVVFPIHVPPLRDRPDDIPLLVAHFLRRLRRDVPRPVERVNNDAMEALRSYRWPGNVRELSNVVHRAMLSADGEEIRLADLPADVAASVLVMPTRSMRPTDGRSEAVVFPANRVVPLEELERRAIAHALAVTGGCMARAARQLGMGRATLYRRVTDLGLVRKGGNAP